jgi:2-keto-4-pentenoate hydratase
MNPTDIDTAARHLLQARASNRQLSGLPPECILQDAAEAYAIQDAVSAALGPVGGWKVGAKGPDAQPSCAPLPFSLIYPAPCSLPPSASGQLGIEAEIAVRLKQDLPPRGTPYIRDEVIAAIGSIHPAIEIVAYRFADHGQQSPLTLLADALGNSTLLYGTGRNERFDIDQTSQPVQLYFGTSQVADAVGGNPAGDIFRLLVWLANHAARRCGGLRAGQIVTTGSCTGLLYAKAGVEVNAAFPGLGDIAFSIEDAA